MVLSRLPVGRTYGGAKEAEVLELMPSIERDQKELRMKVRSRRGLSADLEVLDISIGGAMVEARGWTAAPGDRVLVTLPGLSAQPAEMVWIEDGRGGIAFEQPLHETVFERFAALVANNIRND